MAGQGMRMQRGKAALVLSCVAFGFAAAIAMPQAAVGAESHAFNPKLSLTGDCGTSGLDPIPDPGLCPMPPGVPGVDHPPAAFKLPKSIATDSYGNIFVASYGSEEGGVEKTGGRIDIFTSNGFYITEIPDDNGPKSLAVDSKGTLYVFDFRASTIASPRVSKIVRYKPTLYNPAADEIAYGNPPELAVETGANFMVGLAVANSNDRLFANFGKQIAEYGSAEEGNALIDGTIGEGVLSNASSNGVGVAVDAKHGRIYASDSGAKAVQIFELAPPHAPLMTISGADKPGELAFTEFPAVAADEGTGHFFIFDPGGPGANLVYEFDEGGAYLSTIGHSFQPTFGTQIAVDNGINSPNGAKNPFRRFLFVPSHPSGTGHAFAFGPPEPKAPVVTSTSFSGVTETEAKLEATIKPEFLETEYTFEYTTLEAFETETEKFENAEIAGGGSIPAGEAPVKVSAAAEGLKPGSTYVFRVVTENEKGEDEATSKFITFPAAETPSSCANDVFRTGASALLPDCRAYELVTPPDTNARAPLFLGYLGGYFFGSPLTSSTGNKATFQIEGGSVPGFEATGSYGGDPYLASRGEDGWTTAYTGPTPAESPALIPGGPSPDQGYSFWATGSNKGSAAIAGSFTSYLRYPDGHSALIGRGSLGVDPLVEGKLISPGGGHVIFVSRKTPDHVPVPLEETSPPEGTNAIYDRTIDSATGEEQTHVISLLPGDETPAAGKNAFFEGASPNGKGVAFSIGATLYLRYDNEETYEIDENVTFAGFAAGGKRVFYVKGGNLFAYEAEGEANPIQFSSSGNATLVNVAPDGSVAYFVSPSSLVGEPNPNGDLPIGGQPNLYRSEEGTLAFVGTVTGEDVGGKETGVGFGNWIPHVVSFGEAAEDPSRTTPDGSVLLFESEAPLAGYDPEGHTEVYRYDIAQNELRCLSCNPTLAPATGDGTLQSMGLVQNAPEALSPFARVDNLRSDGRRAFFQSTEALASGDTDGQQDVYEWEDQGVGSCKQTGGCVYLISSGHSRRPDYLWAVSEAGDDVFFRSADLLLGIDVDETPSIYDARVDGGFPEEPEIPCEQRGDCPETLPTPPVLPAPATPALGSTGNVEEVKCPKGRRKAVRNGNTVCVKKHKKHKKHHRKAGTKRKGASK